MKKTVGYLMAVVCFFSVSAMADETPVSITGNISRLQIRGQYYTNNDAQTNMTVGGQVFSIYPNDSKYSALVAAALAAKIAGLPVTIEYTKSTCIPNTETWCRIQDIVIN